MHSHWLKNESKMSKSVGNVVDPQALIKKYGNDAVRYYFLASGLQKSDINFDEKLLKDIFYKDIPDSLINLLLRLSNSKIIEINKFNKFDIWDEEYSSKINENIQIVEEAKTLLLEYNFTPAAGKIHQLLSNLNHLIHSSEFWKKLDDEEYIKKISCFTFEFLRISTILLTPYLPELMKNVSYFIGIKPYYLNFKFCFFRDLSSISDNMIDLQLINFKEMAREFGYFRVDLNYKSKIFIPKMK
jgi:methionyl-tRNA synthetase